MPKEINRMLSEINIHIQVIQKHSHTYAEVTLGKHITKDIIKVKLYCLGFTSWNNHTKYQHEYLLYEPEFFPFATLTIYLLSIKVI